LEGEEKEQVDKWPPGIPCGLNKGGGREPRKILTTKRIKREGTKE